VWLTADIKSGYPIKRISINFNQKRVYESRASFPANYLFSGEIFPEEILPQNILEIEAEDQVGAVGRDSVIFYK
jgi:hypothetical protein